MYRISIAFAALTLAAAPAAFADENSPAQNSSAPSDVAAPAKAPHAIHYRSSSAAPLAADERSLADMREQRQTRAMNLIGAAGYDDFSGLTADGNNFRATAMKGGQRMSVLVDPDGGHVTPAQ